MENEHTNTNRVIQFGSGILFSTPTSGNKVTFWQYWTLHRIRVALFGRLEKEVSIDITKKVIKSSTKNGYLYTVNADELMSELFKQKGKFIWVKPNWMRRIASLFRPKTKHEGAKG